MTNCIQCQGCGEYVPAFKYSWHRCKELEKDWAAVVDVLVNRIVVLEKINVRELEKGLLKQKELESRLLREVAIRITAEEIAAVKQKEIRALAERIEEFEQSRCTAPHKEGDYLTPTLRVIGEKEYSRLHGLKEYADDLRKTLDAALEKNKELTEQRDAAQSEVAKRQDTRESFYEHGKKYEFERIVALLDKDGQNEYAVVNYFASPTGTKGIWRNELRSVLAPK